VMKRCHGKSPICRIFMIIYLSWKREFSVYWMLHDVTTAVVESRWQATLPYAFLGVNFHFRFRLNLHHQLKLSLRKKNKKMLDHVGSWFTPGSVAPIARLEAPDGSSCNATCVPTEGLSCRDIRGTDRVSCQLRSLVDTNGVWLGQRTHRKRAGNGLKSGGELLFFFWGVVCDGRLLGICYLDYEIIIKQSPLEPRTAAEMGWVNTND
jgi:hypothetical protein